MSAVETPPPQPPAPGIQQRRCPRCGAALTGEQEWCLECGAGVGATVAGSRSWRGPVALVGVLLGLAAIAVVLALVELAGEPEQVTEQTAAPTATPAAATPTPESTTIDPTLTPTPTIPPASDSGGTTPEIADWPAGKDAWTVVLEAASTEDAATVRAQELIEQGVPVGLLNSDDYPSLEPGRWVVFSGQYDSQRAADQGLTDVSDQVEGAYVRRVSPSGGASAPSGTVTPDPTP